MKPTEHDKNTGLDFRYVVTKADGSFCDPNAHYLVLRLDDHEDCDPVHTAACRMAALMYAKAISEHLPLVSSDLVGLVERLQKDAMGLRIPVGIPGNRDPENPCEHFATGDLQPGEFADCQTDGHYLCDECRNKATEEPEEPGDEHEIRIKLAEELGGISQ